MPRVYADEAAYLAEHDTAPDNVDRLLRLASAVVDRLLVGRVYPTDAQAMPTDPDHEAAMREATVAIAAEAAAKGVTKPGGTGQWQSVSIGNVSLSGPITSSDGAITVAGIPVPGEALLLLSEVGARTVWTYR